MKKQKAQSKALRLLEGPQSPFPDWAPHSVKHNQASHVEKVTQILSTPLLNSREICIKHFRELHSKWFSKQVKILMSTEMHVSQGFWIQHYWHWDQAILCWAVLCNVWCWAASQVSNYQTPVAPLANWENKQLLWKFPTVSWLRTTGLDYLENGCWEDTLPDHGMWRKHCCATSILTEFGWNEHEVIKQKACLKTWTASPQSHLRRKVLDSTHWIYFAAEPQTL